MHLPSAPRLMNAPNTPNSIARRRTTSHQRLGKSQGHHTRAPAFHDTLPIEPRDRSPQDSVTSQTPTIARWLNTYLTAYLLIFFVTLAVLLLTTDLTLALDVVQLVACEALWFTPIVGTVLVLAPWRIASRRRPNA